MERELQYSETRGFRIAHLVIAGAGAGLISVLAMIMTLTTSMVPGASFFWLPAAFQTSFAVWFGIWGCLAGAIGTFFGGMWGGSPLFYNILANPIPAFLANGLAVWVGFKVLRVNPELPNLRDWIFGGVIVVVASVFSAALGAIGTIIAGMGAPAMAWGVVFPGWALGDTICGVVLGLPMLRLLTGFVKKSGLYVKGFLS
jgi:hypothetical protein